MKPKTIPGFDGRPPIHGADAYESDKPKTSGKKGRKFTHPLDLMLAKKTIPHNLWLAGVRFRSDWELLHCRGEQVVNWDRLINAVTESDRTRAKSSMGIRAPKQPFTYREHMPRIVDAEATLNRMAKRVGKIGFSLMVSVCGRGMGIEEVATAWGDDRRYLGRRFREALEEAEQFYLESIEARARD